MFGFLFRKDKPADHGPAAVPSPAPAAAGAVAPGTAIHYHPELIGKLKQDHQALLALFGSIQAAFAAGRLQEVAGHLDAFRTGIQSHLLIENVRLYIYLEHQLAGDEASHQLIHDFRHEMDGIGKAVVGFLAKYKDLSVDTNLVASFGRDLEAVGKVLVDRIQREETTLYPLYSPAY
jgi:hypothetical protein